MAFGWIAPDTRMKMKMLKTQFALIARATLTGLLLSSTALAQSAASKPSGSSDADTYRQLDLLMDVFEKVRAEYVEKVDDKKLLEGAINGMVSSLDPHSSFLDERDFQSMKVQTEGEYGGLGLEVTWEEGVVKIVSPIDDSPGFNAGLKGGDFITHINKEPVFGGDLSAAVEKMRGVPKTSLMLTIVRREGEKAGKPFDVTLVREVIQQGKVRYDLKSGGIGYIRVPQFHKRAAEGTRTAISGLQKQGAVNGYVLDLRANPGGLLDQAIEISDAFLERGEIVSQRGRKKSDIQRYFAKPGDLTGGKPIVVLVNESSASASEIVAGALQDQRRAVVLGRRSFGKGSVQTLIPIGPETALRLTTARYYTPSGRSVQEQGIEPDIDVAQLSADQKPSDKSPFLSEAELGGHLVNDKKASDRSEEKDAKIDPRQSATVEQLKKQGVDDFQLQYAMQLLRRLGGTAVAAVKK
jgi:carboxyl-terminal processing protease